MAKKKEKPVSEDAREETEPVPEEQAVETNQAPEAADAPETPKTPGPKAEKPKKDQGQLLAEAADKYLRLAAEYDNYRKRTAKEKEGIWTEA